MTMPLDDVQVITVSVPSAVQVVTVQVPGVQGSAGVFKIGTVSTVAYGGNAGATLGTDANGTPVVNLSLPAGAGISAGGAAGAIPVKNTATDYDIGWTTPVAAATASTVVKRDSAGRAQMVDPSAAQDIATKNYTDTQDAATLASAKSYADGKVTDTGWGDLTLANGFTGAVKYRIKNGIFYIACNVSKVGNWASFTTFATMPSTGKTLVDVFLVATSNAAPWGEIRVPAQTTNLQASTPYSGGGTGSFVVNGSWPIG